jgi:hypothetical protein
MDFFLQAFLRKALPFFDPVLELSRLFVVLFRIHRHSSSTGTCQFLFGFSITGDKFAGTGSAAGGSTLFVCCERLLDVDVEEELVGGEKRKRSEAAGGYMKVSKTMVMMIIIIITIIINNIASPVPQPSRSPAIDPQACLTNRRET